MDQPEVASRHLQALAAIAATAEVDPAASGESLLFLRQHLRLRDAHLCQAQAGGPRRLLETGGAAGAECHLPKPQSHQLVCQAETDAGWVAGFVVSNPPGYAVLHLLFDQPPRGDDVAAGVTAAALIGRLLPSPEPGSDHPDPITGLPGRPVLERYILERFAAHDRAVSVSLILADVNGLKAINDRFGHPAGDRLLRRVAAVVSDTAASLDGALAARIGGDEFAIAAVNVSEQAMAEALGRIDSAARDLGNDTGIARGAARLPGDAPGSRTATAAMRGLIRLADAQLYAHKSSTSTPGQHVRREPATSTPNEGDPARGTPMDVPRPLIGRSVEERLSHAAQVIAERANAAAWWISRQDGDTVVDAQCGASRRKPLRWDEPERPVLLDPNAYRLDDFPATRRVLAGGHFHTSLVEGDEAERTILAYYGYRSMIAAGGTNYHGRGWLIEIYGDYLTDDLTGWGETLETAVKTALIEPDTHSPDR